MEIKSEPAYVDLHVRQLEVGVYGDIREVLLYERDLLNLKGDEGIVIQLVKPSGEILEETTFRWDHVQWYTVRYQTIRQQVPEKQKDTRRSQ
jgi:hypothetical protein